MKRNQNQYYNDQSAGFTVIELLVVFLILVLLSSMIVINWNQQKPNRSLTIAQNETITNIRKVQSYAVSSRNINGTVPAKFYILRFGVGQNYYTVNAVGDDYTYYSDLETIRFPEGIALTDLSLDSNSTQKLPAQHPECIQVIYSTIYGKNYFVGEGKCNNAVIPTLKNLPALAPTANYNLTITVTHSQKGTSKVLVIHGLTSKVEIN